MTVKSPSSAPSAGSASAGPSRRMSDADRAGFVARSPEGHAARSLGHIRGREDAFVRIQANTFRNWVNETLKEGGERVEDFGADFRDGVRLVALVERLQRRRLRRTHRRPQSQHHEIENITIALDAIKEDGIKLVNIGEFRAMFSGVVLNILIPEKRGKVP